MNSNQKYSSLLWWPNIATSGDARWQVRAWCCRFLTSSEW